MITAVHTLVYGFGRTAVIAVPGGAGGMMIYKPRHPPAFDID